MSSKQYFVVSGVLFSLVAVAHLIRIAYGMAIQVDAFAVPMYFSWLGLLVPAALATWSFSLISKGRAS